MKFGQKVEAKRRTEDAWEPAVVLCVEGDYVTVGFQNGEAKVLMDYLVRTKAVAWRERHREKLILYQRQRRARLAAEKHGITLEEAVYRQEQRRARRIANRDPNAKQRQYWRERQRAHREKKAESDGD